jgi:DNA-binding protein HU-beta
LLAPDYNRVGVLSVICPNKGERVGAIAAKANVTKKSADALPIAMVDAIVEVMSAGDKVTQLGFGSKEAAPTRSLSYGRNPKTGEQISFSLIIGLFPIFGEVGQDR